MPIKCHTKQTPLFRQIRVFPFVLSKGEGWTEKSGQSPCPTVHASMLLGTNAWAGKAIPGLFFGQNPKNPLPCRLN